PTVHQLRRRGLSGQGDGAMLHDTNREIALFVVGVVIALLMAGLVGYLLAAGSPAGGTLVFLAEPQNVNGTFFANVTIAPDLAGHLLILSLWVSPQAAPCGTSGYAPDTVSCSWTFNDTASGNAPFGSGSIPPRYSPGPLSGATSASSDQVGPGTYSFVLHVEEIYGPFSTTSALRFDAVLKIIDLGSPSAAS
ncbi:MAG: hypothetical protein L3J73_00400, partial [Thermoplasmata archaeon]|nr:hypothetical protein [Thermoplasmata archaeon]